MADSFNVETKVEGNKLVIEVDLTKERGFSSSFKNILIGTSGGGTSVPGKPGLKYGLNVYRDLNPEERKKAEKLKEQKEQKES